MDIQSHIVGIGGVFFKSQDPKQLTKWYKDKLGFSPIVRYYEDDDAITFPYKTMNDENNNWVWAPFPQDTEVFKPSSKDFMINYIVKDIETLIKSLRKEGVEFGEFREYEFGKMIVMQDPEGNAVEFWEPNTQFFKSKYNN